MTENASLLGFEYTALIEDLSIGGVPSKKSVGFTSTIPKDCTQEEIDALLDKCRLAVRRQRAFAELDARVIDLRNHEEAMLTLRAELDREDAGFAERADEHPGRAGRGLSQPEKNARAAKVTQLENAVRTRDEWKKRIEELRSMVGRPIPAEAPRGFPG
jgi:hypothetical protein